MTRRPRGLPPIRTWCEPIDAATVAGLATCQETRPMRQHARYNEDGTFVTAQTRRHLFGLSVFVIVKPKDGERWSWLQARAQDEARRAIENRATRGVFSLEDLGPCDAEDPS